MLTAEQREKRKRFIGSSDAAALVGRDPWRNRGDLFLEKAGLLDRDKSSVAADMGNDLESAVLNMFERRIGLALERDIFLERDEIFCANLDGAILNPDTSRPRFESPVDAKTSGLREHWGEERDDMPTHVLIQLQWQMMVIGSHSTKAFAPAFFPGKKWFEFDVWSCDRNEDLIEELRVAAFEFWDYVKAGKKPPNAVPQLDTLKRIRREPQSVITLSDEAAAAWRELEKAKEEAKHWESTVEQRKAAVLDLLGDAEAGLLPSGDEIRYLEQNGARRIDLDLLERRAPDLYAEFVTQPRHRVLRLKKAPAVKVKRRTQDAC